MKLTIVICFIFATNNFVNGSLVDSVYDKVKNTTLTVKDNVYGFYTSGKEFIFGKDDNTRITEANVIVKEQKGLITTIYGKIYHFLDIFGETNETESSGFMKRMYERIKNRIVKFKRIILPDIKTIKDGKEDNLVKTEDGNLKKVKEAISKMFLDRSLNLTTIKDNDIIEKWDTLINDIEVKRKDLPGQAQSVYEKEVELMKMNFKKMQDNLKNLNEGAKIVGDDVRKLSTLASDAAKKDFEEKKEKNI